MRLNLKLNNKILYRIYYIVLIWVLILNILMRLFPDIFVVYTVPTIYDIVYPDDLFRRLSILFNIPIGLFFIVPLILEFNTSMIDIGFLGSKNKYNKAILQKLTISTIVAIVLYCITIINGYSIYIREVLIDFEKITVFRMIFSSFVPLIFLVSLNLIVSIFMKGNAFCIFISVGYYLLIENQYPILDIFIHLNRNEPAETIIIKQILQLIIAIVLILISIKKLKSISC